MSPRPNVSAHQEAEGLSLRLFHPSQSVVVVNGIDFEELDRMIAGHAMHRESLGLAPDDLVLGCVTRFDPIKRVETLLHAVQRLVAELDLRRRVIFTGFLENPVRIYPTLDLYVATSLKEGLPLSLLEAMGAGLAVVATDVPGHREVIVHGDTGLLVPAEDPVALAEAVASLLADPVRRRRMGEAGRQRALKEFSIQSMVEGTAEVYRRASASTTR